MSASVASSRRSGGHYRRVAGGSEVDESLFTGVRMRMDDAVGESGRVASVNWPLARDPLFAERASTIGSPLIDYLGTCKALLHSITPYQRCKCAGDRPRVLGAHARAGLLLNVCLVRWPLHVF